MKKLTVIGSVLSTIWCGFFIALVYFKWNSIADLKLNEWGDFFAGAVAPLGFFWLVLGYLQQGEELRLNTDALKAQQKELERQVHETALLAEHSERQAAAAEQLALATLSESQRAALKEKMDALPVFRQAGGSGGSYDGNTVLRIRNAGGTVTNLSATRSNGGSIRISPPNLFEAGTTGTLVFSNQPSWPFSFSISFTDKFGNTAIKNYELTSQFDFTERI